MENQNINKEQNWESETNWNSIEKNHRRGKIIGGLLVIVIGSLFLARELGAQIPFWVFTWKTLLIGIGIVIAIKHKFRHPAWIVLIAIGGAFLFPDIYPGTQIKPFLWPSIIILIGLIMVFKPRRKNAMRCRKRWERSHGIHKKHIHAGNESYNLEEFSREDLIESISIMSGTKKNVISKKFKGGEVVNIFGGTELNLSQADFEGKASLEIAQVFGGTELIVPSNWEIRSELVTIFGSVEDKRTTQPGVGGEATKVLVLTGTTVFGGIEIKSF